MRWKSLKFKVGVSYFFLNVISICIFSWVISINQLELISENSRFQARELIGSLVSGLHKIPVPVSSGTPSEDEQQRIVAAVATMLSRQVPNYVIYSDSLVLNSSAQHFTLLPILAQQAARARALVRNTGVEYHLVLSDDRSDLEVFIPLGQIGLDNTTVYSKISLSEISERYRDMYQLIGLTVVVITLLHFLFGLFLFRMVVKPILLLQAGTDRIANGDYTVKVKLKSNDEIGMLASGFNHMTEALQGAFLRLHKQMEELKAAHDVIQRMAITDELTGLFNRRHFFEYLRKQIAQSYRYGKPLGVALLDVDNFKNVNDTYGHVFGDKVLREIGALLGSMVRESDIAARYGGEEIILLFPETDLAQSMLAADKFRQAIMDHKFELPSGEAVVVTASFGVAEIHASFTKPLKDAATLQIAYVECADKALYKAKHAGRNRVMAYNPAEA